MEKCLIPDLHLKKFLISGGQLLGPRGERQQEPQQTPVEQLHPGNKRQMLPLVLQANTGAGRVSTPDVDRTVK